jgi:acyl-CoA ligase (AMP-forming) (exosortase A-associated)
MPLFYSSPLFLHDLAHDSALHWPDAIAVSMAGQRQTYAMLWAHTTLLANQLCKAGLQRGDRVGIYLEKRFEAAHAFLAVSLAGGVFVPINPILKPAQVAHILNDCEAAFFMSHGPRLEGLLADPAWAKPSAGLHTVFLLEGATCAPRPATWTETRFVDWPSSFLPDEPSRSPMTTGRTESDLAALFYTSGSTGRPKGVMLTHRNLVAGALSVAHYLENGPDDVLLAALPLSFDAGFSQLSTAFAVGARVELLNYLMPRDILRAVEREKVTGLTAVAPLWVQLSGLDWGKAGASLRYFANTGGRLPHESLQRLRAALPQAKPFLMYGLTEAFRATYLDPAQVDQRPDSIGKAIPNAQILVLREDGFPCKPGESGELVQRGPLVAKGYWNDAVRTAERFRPLPEHAIPSPQGGGWPEYAVFSGDTVVQDAEGFLYFLGRTDAMIKTSGYRVSPEEIEEALYDTGLVAEAAAFGIPDEQLGHRVGVIVCPKTDALSLPADQLKARLRVELKQRLPTYLQPAVLQVHPDPLPRNPNGKLDRPRIPELISLLP